MSNSEEVCFRTVLETKMRQKFVKKELPWFISECLDSIESMSNDELNCFYADKLVEIVKISDELKNSGEEDRFRESMVPHVRRINGKRNSAFLIEMAKRVLKPVNLGYFKEILKLGVPAVGPCLPTGLWEHSASVKIMRTYRTGIEILISCFSK